MCALAYDRYDLLAHPFQRKLKAKDVAIVLTTIFSFDAFLCSLPVFGWSEYLPYRLPQNPDLIKCRLSQQETNAADWAFLPTFDFCAFIVPYIIMIVIYVKIVQLVISHARNVQQAVSRHTGVHYRRSRLPVEESASARVTAVQTSDSYPSHRFEDHAQPTTISLMIVKSKAFHLVTTAIITNMALTLPFVIVVELEKFRVIIIKVFPDVMKSILMALFHFNFVFNAVIYIVWVRNAVRFAAERAGFRRGGLLIRFIKAFCLQSKAYLNNNKAG